MLATNLIHAQRPMKTLDSPELCTDISLGMTAFSPPSPPLLRAPTYPTLCTHHSRVGASASGASVSMSNMDICSHASGMSDTAACTTEMWRLCRSDRRW